MTEDLKRQEMGLVVQSIERATARLKKLMTYPDTPEILLANERVLIIMFAETLGQYLSDQAKQEAAAHMKVVIDNTGRAPLQ